MEPSRRVRYELAAHAQAPPANKYGLVNWLEAINQTVPMGRMHGYIFPRHFVPGSSRLVPPGQKNLRLNSLIRFYEAALVK
jgi:hypothetical protein